jgi:hypothetical protein
VTAVTPPKIMAPIARAILAKGSSIGLLLQNPSQAAGGEAAVSPKDAAIVLQSLVVAGTRARSSQV